MPPLLTMSAITRAFGATRALGGVDLEIAAGEVHALVGENGAGKSTLMKILSGAEKPDSGSISFRDQPFQPRTPRDALQAGVAMIYQELNLAPHLSVIANLTLGSEQTIGGFMKQRLPGAGIQRRCRETLGRLGLNIPLNARVGGLGVATQQMIEIARALLADARLIVMDEPTSALATAEVEKLFVVIEQLRASGVSVIYISHFLEEIERIADRLTIIRDGKTVGTGAVRDWPRKRIIEAMVGRHVEEMYPQTPHAIGAPLLTVSGLAGKRVPKRAAFTLHRGEVLGIAGLVGSGRTEMLRALFGLDPNRGGTATIDGKRIERFSPADWTHAGTGLLSEDRKAEGLAQNVSCIANITLPALEQASRYGVIRRAIERRRSDELGRVLRIKWGAPEQKVSSLSGGNQQKVAMARLLFSEADVLLLDEPTRGIDVGAKVDLYRAIGDLASRGKGIVIVSSYLPELFGTCDRIAVMSRGVLTEPHDVKTLSPEHVMHLAIGE